MRTDGLRGGLLAWDGQLVDDARLVVTIARTAASFGAKILTRCAATQVTGRGAVLRDTLTGATVDVAARMVINAAGVWAGQLAPGITLRPSRGTHLVLVAGQLRRAERRAHRSGGRHDQPVRVRAARAGSAGVRRADRRGRAGRDPGRPAGRDGEIDFLLDTVNTALRTPLTRADLLGTYSGLRPLLDTGGDSTADISRKHAVLTAPDGLVTVVGGKLTTYRRMAAGRARCRAARGRAAAASVRHRAPAAGRCGRAPLDRAPTGWCGATAPRRSLVAADPALLVPVADGVDTTVAELRFGVTHEGALDEADLLERRTRVALSPARRGLPPARWFRTAAATGRSELRAHSQGPSSGAGARSTSQPASACGSARLGNRSSRIGSQRATSSSGQSLTR